MDSEDEYGGRSVVHFLEDSSRLESTNAVQPNPTIANSQVDFLASESESSDDECKDVTSKGSQGGDTSDENESKEPYKRTRSLFEEESPIRSESEDEIVKESSNSEEDDDGKDLFSDSDSDLDNPTAEPVRVPNKTRRENTRPTTDKSGIGGKKKNSRRKAFRKRMAEMEAEKAFITASTPIETPTPPSEYFDPVRTEEGKTIFPEDFFSPNGLSNYEYAEVVQQYRLSNGKRVRGRSSLFSDYDGHHSKKYAKLAAETQVECPPEREQSRRAIRYEEILGVRGGYIKPDTTWLKSKYARYLIRDNVPLPSTFPFAFFPHTHEYEYGQYGLENVITGTLSDGHSCTIRALGYRPYCYFEIPDEVTKLPNGSPRPVSSTHDILKKYLAHLDSALKSQLVSEGSYLLKQLQGCDSLIDLRPTVMNHINSREYHGDNKKPFLKIFALHPQLIRHLRKLIQRPFGGLAGDTFESDEPDGWLPKEEFAGYGIKEISTVCDAHVDYTVRFLVDLGLKAAGAWFVFSQHHIASIPIEKRISHSNLELVTSYQNLRSASDLYVEKHHANVIDGKFDIEVETGKVFPKPEYNPVTQIVMRFRFGPLGSVTPGDSKHKINTPMKPGETIRKPGCAVNICLCLKETSAFEDFDVHVFNNERDLLMAFHELMIIIQPDYLCGHFSDNFDWDYLLTRAKHLGLIAFPYFARLYKKAARNDVRNQKAKKKMLRGNTHISGMVVWDSLKWTKDMTFETSLGLNALAMKKLKLKKIDVEYSLIGTLMKTKEGRSLLCDYCNYDVVLLEKLDDKMTALKQLHEMSNLCNIPIQLLGDRASTFRMMGLWLFYTQRFYNLAFPKKTPKHPQMDVGVPTELGPYPGPDCLNDTKSPYFFHDLHLSQIFFLTPSPDLFRPEGKKGKYGGGCVFEPIRGFFQIPNSTLDFTSLYPSIMRAFNLGFVTYVPAGQQKFFCDALGLDINRDLWHEPVFLMEDGKRTTRPYIDMDRNPSYVRPHVMLSLIRYIEGYVLGARKQAKATMGEYFAAAKEECDPVLKAALLFLAGKYNVFQMVLKVICNGMYGALGMSGGAFSLRPCAKTITNVARQSLEHTRYFVFRTVRVCNGWSFNVVITYGDTDSVFPLAIDPQDGTPIQQMVLPTEMAAREFLFKNFDEVCRLVNETLPKEMNLDFEKTSERSYHCTPKCYVLRMCEGMKKDYFTMAKGLSFVRRGGCQFQRTICKNMIDALMERGDRREAIQIVRDAIRRVLSGDLTLAEILIRSSLSQEIEEYDDPKPPHVIMAEKIFERTGTKLRAGDCVHYIVTPAHPNASVADRVEGPDEVIDKSLTYDRAYYLEVVLKEAKKLLRPLVDPATFTERFMFSEWVRITKFTPHGNKKIAKAKTDLKKTLDKRVESVVLWGKEIDFDNSPKSLYVLPDEYQGELFKPTWHWAGLDPDEKIPHISEWNPPWIKTKEDRLLVISQITADLESEEVDSLDSDEYDSDDEPLALDLKESSIESPNNSTGEKAGLSRLSQFCPTDSDSDDESDDEEDDDPFFAKVDLEDENGQTILEAMNIHKKRKQNAFAEMFIREKKERQRYLSTIISDDYLRNVKHGEIPESSPLFHFTEKQKPCVRCNKTISEKYLTLCRPCERKMQTDEPRKKYVREIEEICAKWEKQKEETYSVCIKCVTDRYNVVDEGSRDILISECASFLCHNRAPRRESVVKFSSSSRNVERVRKLKMQLDIEIENEDAMDFIEGVGHENDVDESYGYNSGICRSKEDLKRRREEENTIKQQEKQSKKRKQTETKRKKQFQKSAGSTKKLFDFFSTET